MERQIDNSTQNIQQIQQNYSYKTQKRQSSTNSSSNSTTKGNSPNIRPKQYINQSGQNKMKNQLNQKTFPSSSQNHIDKKNGERNQQRGMIRDPRPERVLALEKHNIYHVICGSDQTFCITKSPENHLYSWGSNQNAKLGHSYYKPSPNNIVKQPTIVKALENQKQMDQVVVLVIRLRGAMKLDQFMDGVQA